MRRLHQQDPEVAKLVDGKPGRRGLLRNDQNANATGERQIGECEWKGAISRYVAVQDEHHRTSDRGEDGGLPGPTRKKMGNEENA